MDKIVYDVEIENEVHTVPGKWNNPEGMGFACAVTYSYNEDRYRFWLKNKKELCEYLNNKIAISFNGIKFDSRVLLGNDRRVTSIGYTYVNDVGWQNFDILDLFIRTKYGFKTFQESENKLNDKTIHDGSFSLDGLSEGTLGLHKTGHGAHAPVLYQEGRYAELFEYNLQDVRLTKKLYDFIQKYHYVVDRNGVKYSM